MRPEKDDGRIRDRYRTMMKGIEAPDDLDGRVIGRLQALRDRQERETGERTGRGRRIVLETEANGARTEARLESERRPRSRTVLYSCAAAAAAAGIVFTLVGGLGGIPGNAPGGSGDDSTSGFGLVSYADAAEGDLIGLSTEDDGMVPAGQALFSCTRFKLNLSCSGEDIREVTYSIEDGTSERRVRFASIYPDPDDPDSHDLVVMETGSSFTVASGEGDGVDIIREIYVDQESDELASLDARIATMSQQLEGMPDGAERDQLAAQRDAVTSRSVEVWNAQFEDAGISGPDISEETLNAVETRQAFAAAQMIAQARLTVTATLTDGSTISRSYRISPVDDFEARYTARLEASQLDVTAADPEDPRLHAALFTLCEVG